MIGLEHPIVLAPMAGGPATVALAAAVSGAGGLGFLAAGYRSAGAVREEIRALRAAVGDRPFGVNVFVSQGSPSDAAVVEGYASRLCDAGIAVGAARWDDDDFAGKVAVVLEERPAVASFTFGAPPQDVVLAVHGRGIEVWVTVTTPDEALAAMRLGADAVVCQGVEAGGHRGGFDAGAPGDLGLLALLQLVGAAVDVPMVATGGIATGAAVAAVLACGATAAALGTAFMLAPEAGTPPAQREALRSGRPTAITRAFSGRPARGIVNAFMRSHSDAAPLAYPEVHHLTSPARSAARAAGDADGFNIWAGQAHALAVAEPATDIVRRLSREARERLGS